MLYTGEKRLLLPMYCDQVVCAREVIHLVADIRYKRSTLLQRHRGATRDKKKSDKKSRRKRIRKERGEIDENGRCTVEEGLGSVMRFSCCSLEALVEVNGRQSDRTAEEGLPACQVRN